MRTYLALKYYGFTVLDWMMRTGTYKMALVFIDRLCHNAFGICFDGD